MSALKGSPLEHKQAELDKNSPVVGMMTKSSRRQESFYNMVGTLLPVGIGNSLLPVGIGNLDGFAIPPAGEFPCRRFDRDAEHTLLPAQPREPETAAAPAQSGDKLRPGILVGNVLV